MTREIKESIYGKVYKIVSSETDEVYVGSTTQALKKRLQEHKSEYKRYLQGRHNFVSSFNIVKFADAKIILIHDDLFDTRADLHRLEGQYMMSVENCINAHIAGRTSKEHYQHNRERVLQSVKDYYQDNKPHKKEYNKTYKERNKEKLKEQKGQVLECPVCETTYTHNHKARHEKSSKHRSALSQASSSELPATDTTEYGARSQSSSSELSAMENLTSD